MFNIKKISWLIITLFMGVCAFCAIAPINYTTTGNLLKLEGNETLSIGVKPGRYVVNKNIKECKITIGNIVYNAHIKYVQDLGEQTIFDCWLEEEDRVDYGAYYFKTSLGQVKMWSILLNIF